MYEEVVEALQKAFDVMPEGVDLSKGGLGELAMAHALGHTLVAGDKGADAVDSDGKLYEYKVSTTNQFNFNHGARRATWEENQATIERHFEGIEGAWVGHREGMNIVETAYVPTTILLPALLLHFRNTKGGQLTKNYRLKQFKELNEW
jgi:hypothetical protein